MIRTRKHTDSCSLRFLSLMTITMMLLTPCLGGCKQDEFSKAPVARAPTSQTSAMSKKMGVARQPGSAGKLVNIPQSGQLPANHPPVGTSTSTLPKDIAPRARVPSTGAIPNTYGTNGPVLWTAPVGWQPVRPSSSMRKAEYLIEGDAGSAVLSVFYFGPGGGGGVDANLKRWAGQFKGHDGKPALVKKAVETVSGMKVHRMDVSGNYNAGAAMMGGGTKKDQRVLGAIVESPAGLYFFKLLGPQKTMLAQEKNFDAFVASFKPGA